MNRSQYYLQMRQLASEKREKYGVVTSEITIPFIKKIYKEEGVKVDYRELPPKIRAAYFCDEDDCSVLINKKLPREPKLFSLVHELKHHYVDRDVIEDGQIQCGDYNANEVIEIGAEVFAAEFIFPEDEILKLITSLGINKQNCTPEGIVKIKRNSPVSISYKFIVKTLERLRFCSFGKFSKVRFQKLEEEIYGQPIYKQTWFKERRKRKRNNN